MQHSQYHWCNTSRAARATALAALPICLLVAGCETDRVSLGAEEAPLEGPPAEEGPCAGGVVSGNVTAGSQEEIDALAGCEVIQGYLRIDGFEGMDLRPLGALRVVHRALTVSGADSLEGLDALEQVGSLRLGELLSEDLSPLRGLTRVLETPLEDEVESGSIDVIGCHRLADLTGLENLLQWDRLMLSNNDQLVSLRGLRPPRQAGHLWVVNQPMLRDLSPFEDVQEMSTVWLWNTGVEHFDDFNLLYLNDLGLKGNPALRSLDGLDKLRRLGSLQLFDNDGLESLPELPDLVAMTTLQIMDNDELRSVPTYAAGAPVGTSIGWDGGSSISGPDTLLFGFMIAEIGFNPKLTAAGIPSGFSSGRYVAVFDNPDLINLDLGALEDVDTLTIRNNASLSSLDISALQSVDALEVVGNSQLSTSAFEAVKAFTRDISDNLGDTGP